MNKLLMVGTLWLGVCAAQPVTPPETTEPTVVERSAPPAFASEEARASERRRLDLKSQQIEDQYKQELKQCYQQFDVVSCRLNARDRRIEAKAALRQEELPFKAMERQIKAENAKQRLAERQSEARLKQQEADRAQALLEAKQRSDANTQKQIDHALKGTKRAAYEQKLRDAEAHRAKVEKKQRESGKEPAAPLPVPGR